MTASASATELSAESVTTEPVDLTSSPHSLHRAVYARRAEYVRPHRIRIKVGTWNVAACPGTDKDLASWFVSGKGIDKRLASLDIANNPAVDREHASDGVEDDPNAVRLVGGDQVGLYVLGLQEVVDLNVASQVTRVYADGGPSVTTKWKMALEAALPSDYDCVASEQMSGLLLLIYASPAVAPTVSNVSTSAVGTGLLGYLGNKGAVTTRLLLGETTRMAFVNCHLASGHDTTYLERRCWDVGQIVSRTQFEPISHAGLPAGAPEKIGDEDFAFWFGDLNFRLDGLPGDDIRRILMLHTRGEYDVKRNSANEPLDGEDAIVLRSSESSDEQTDRDSSTTHSTDPSNDNASFSLPDPDEFLPGPSDDPTSLQATLDSLISHDQLQKTIKERKAFHDGWREGPITFLPSYKYDIGAVGLFDSSEKRRAPSWCDRILYRTSRDKQAYERRVLEEEESRKKDEDMKARGMDHAGDDEEVLFDYDPENDGDEQPQGSAVVAYDEYEDNDGGDAGGVGDDGGQVITREGFTDRIKLDIYSSHQRIQSSDHKPVISIFTLDYDAVAPALKAKVHAEVARELDRAENEGRPGITIVVDGQEASAGTTDGHPNEAIDFGEVEYLQKKTCSLTIANTGRVPATSSFVETPSTEEMDGSAPPLWLTTSFARRDAGEGAGEAIDVGKEVTLEPGETVNVLVELLVDEITHVRMLNDGQARLEDVLVLRVTEGRDHFIPVCGSWAPTCIGRSIDELIRVPDGGIRPFIRSRSKEKPVTGSIPYELVVHCAAPKELFKLTEAVETFTDRALADEQMLVECQVPRDKPGWPFESPLAEPSALLVTRVIDALDNDRHIADAFEPETSASTRLEVVSRVLLLFLGSLTDGIVTMPLWTRLEQASLRSLGPGGTTSRVDADHDDDKTAVLDILSSTPNHNISFVFLTATLAKIIAELAPLSRADVEATKPSGRGMGAIGRRSLSFRKSGPSAATEALLALERRHAKERRYADIFGKAVCRAVMPAKDKERKTLEDKQRALLALFLRREDVG